MDFIIFLIGVALTIIPMWRLTEKAGYNPLWSLASVTGIGLIVLLWLLAMRLAPKSGGGI
jgi:hypothetical protein